MADKALGNRGLLGRLKQQLFAGGQKSESISVAFQMADMRDGWKLVQDSNEEGDGQGEEGEARDGEAGEDRTGSDEVRGGTSGSEGSGDSSSSSSEGENSDGKSGSNGVSNEDILKEIGDKGVQSLMTLIKRIERLEDNVGVGPGSQGAVNESTLGRVVDCAIAKQLDACAEQGRGETCRA